MYIHGTDPMLNPVLRDLYIIAHWTLIPSLSFRAFLIAQLVKNPPAMQETPVRFLGREDPLEKGLSTCSGILGLPLWLSW